MFDYNELKNLSPEELTNRLILLDRQMLMYHRNAAYKNELKNSYDINADYRSLFNLCVIGICAYNNITLNPNQISTELCKDILINPDKYITPFRIPPMMMEYYTEVFVNGNLDYLTNFIENRNKVESGNNASKGAMTKATAVGRAMAERENGFASVLILPAMLALIYIATVVIYFVFLYGG